MMRWSCSYRALKEFTILPQKNIIVTFRGGNSVRYRHKVLNCKILHKHKGF